VVYGADAAGRPAAACPLPNAFVASPAHYFPNEPWCLLQVIDRQPSEPGRAQPRSKATVRLGFANVIDAFHVSRGQPPAIV
jgi:hypothetical protein